VVDSDQGRFREEERACGDIREDENRVAHGRSFANFNL